MVIRWRRAVDRVTRARSSRGSVPRTARLLTVATLVVAGLMISVSALAARGGELRPSGSGDVIDLVRAESERNAELAATLSQLQAEVDELAARGLPEGPAAERITELSEGVGLSEVKGPAVTVSLDDAPLSVKPAGIDEDLLVVHQQDIQAVVNALWSSGAEAMTIQGQRVTTRTGIKCVGNTVVLHGVPYAPPYVITAIGDTEALQLGLEESAYLQTYRDYAQAYRLGYQVSLADEVVLPGFQGRLDTSWATPG